MIRYHDTGYYNVLYQSVLFPVNVMSDYLTTRPGKCLSQNSQEPCLTVTSESDDWTEDDDVALRPLSAAEHYVSLCNEVTIQAFVQG